MTSEGLEEMFEEDSADTCAHKFPFKSMGALAEGLACADPVTRTPIGVSGNFMFMIILGVCIRQVWLGHFHSHILIFAQLVVFVGWSMSNSRQINKRQTLHRMISKAYHELREN